MDFEAHKRELAAHYAAMAANPATAEQARHSVKQLIADFPQWFGDLLALSKEVFSADHHPSVSEQGADAEQPPGPALG
jgi:hypothetical protein